MYSLPDLPYSYDALAPHIDAQTMEIHHSKHHQGYVNKINAAIAGLPELEKLSIFDLIQNLDKVPVGKEDAVRNNGGGHANHSFFWEILTPGGNKNISPELKQKIDKDFGTLDKLIEEVSDAAATQFGSGWGWLVINKEGNLEAISTPNQDSPLQYGYKPLLNIDVWEHAYYLSYQNKRPDYIKAIWNTINWEQVSKNFAKAIS